MAKGQSAAAKAAEKPVKRKKGRRTVSEGVVHIHSTFNNTIVSITDPTGGVLAWSSAGSVGFKGSRKGTPFAAQLAAEAAAKKAMESGVRAVQVHVKGPIRRDRLPCAAEMGFSITSSGRYANSANGCAAERRRVYPALEDPSVARYLDSVCRLCREGLKLFQCLPSLYGKCAMNAATTLPVRMARGGEALGYAPAAREAEGESDVGSERRSDATSNGGMLRGIP